MKRTVGSGEVHPSILWMQSVRFGDVRIDRRAIQLLQLRRRHPSATFRRSLKPKQLKAFYRMMESSYTSWRHWLEPIRRGTAEAAARADTVLVIHDTTEFAWPLKKILRKNLVRLRTNAQGFLAHVSLVIKDDGKRTPIGVSHLRPFVYPKYLHDDATRHFWTRCNGVLDHAPSRWMDAINDTAQQIQTCKQIHVMDAETDSYGILHALSQERHSFIVRLAQSHRICVTGSREEVPILSHLQAQPVLGSYTVKVSRRAEPTMPKGQKPARGEREATVVLRTARVEIPKPRSKSSLHKHSDQNGNVPITVVLVEEESPPEGEEAVRWLLATDEHVASVKDARRVASRYEARWLIEEYFKALKTGCGYEKAQLQDASGLLQVLGMNIPIALELLHLRHLAEHASDTPASDVLSAERLILLRAVLESDRIPLDTARDAMLAIALYGGHHQRSKPAGWAVIGRGFQRLLEAEIIWALAKGAS